jgi:hypothetical protein
MQFNARQSCSARRREVTKQAGSTTGLPAEAEKPAAPPLGAAMTAPSQASPRRVVDTLITEGHEFDPHLPPACPQDWLQLQPKQ